MSPDDYRGWPLLTDAIGLPTFCKRGFNVDLTLGQGYSRLLLIEIVSLESIEDLEIIGTLEDIDILK